MKRSERIAAPEDRAGWKKAKSPLPRRMVCEYAPHPEGPTEAVGQDGEP